MNTEHIRSLLTFPLYQPIEHPAFAGEAIQPCEERLQQMLSQLPGASRPPLKTMVDFGCHTGWLCRAFARIGWRTLGVERSPEWLEAANELNGMLELGGMVQRIPEYARGDVLEILTLFNPNFRCDVALCLSLAMYLFKDPETGWAFFKGVSRVAPVMFFDFGGMYAKDVPFSEEEIGELMLKKTDFQSWRKIGESTLGRALFMFTR